MSCCNQQDCQRNKFEQQCRKIKIVQKEIYPGLIDVSQSYLSVPPELKDKYNISIKIVSGKFMLLFDLK